MLNHQGLISLRFLVLVTTGCLVTWNGALAQDTPDPRFGQEGKDVPWVPTPDVLVETMLDMAGVTADDLIMDLGSGDGRTVVAAARRGARAIGVELESNLVELSNQLARDAGVSDRVDFRVADLFKVDLSRATVITMFLLPDINHRLRPTLFNLQPGTRIVSNTWDLSGSDTDPDAPGWTPDATTVLDPCPTWCTSHLWMVPAKVQGVWRLPGGELHVKQEFQRLIGFLATPNGRIPIQSGHLRGNEIHFRIGISSYRGHVTPADTTGISTVMSGTARSSEDARHWRAIRVRP